MIIHGARQASLDFLDGKPLVVEVGSTQLTSDAGLLPIRQFDEQRGLTEQFAAALVDSRSGPNLTHSYAEMTRMRVYGILADYEDQNDHDTLRRDPVFKLLAGRSPEAEDLASQPTLSRFENAINCRSLRNLQEVLIDQFLASFPEPPRTITLDVDTFDDPTHGQQQLTFFHGYYDQYQYLPRVITCAENDQVVMAALLFGVAPPTLGVDEDLEHLVGRMRAVWPDVRILLRADSGFATPEVYSLCERLGLEYTIGLKSNPVLRRNSQELLEEAVRLHEETGQPQRLFDGFAYQAGSWSAPRWVIAKAEAHAQGTNRRFVVTNRAGAAVLPEAAYDAYADRGESENRNKELKCGLHADRLSNHRFLANYFRLYLHCLAANLLSQLRQAVASPPEPPVESELPPEARAGRERRRWFNHRREQDPLGEGHPATWRTRLIKVAAEVIVSTRRIVIRLSGVWPHLGHYFAVCAVVAQGQSSLGWDTG